MACVMNIESSALFDDDIVNELCELDKRLFNELRELGRLPVDKLLFAW